MKNKTVLWAVYKIVIRKGASEGMYYIKIIQKSDLIMPFAYLKATQVLSSPILCDLCIYILIWATTEVMLLI